MTWRSCLDARGALDPVAAADALRQARRTGRTFDVLLSEEVGGPGLGVWEGRAPRGN